MKHVQSSSIAAENYPLGRDDKSWDTPRKITPTSLDINQLRLRLPKSFTKVMLVTTITLKAFTVISTYLMVVLYRVASEMNPISNMFGVNGYMLFSATIVCFVICILYRKGPRDVAFPLLFGLFLMALFDASIDATTSLRLIIFAQ